MIGKHPLFGTDLKYVLVLALLAWMTYTLPSVKAAIVGYTALDNSYAVAQAAASTTFGSTTKETGSTTVKSLLPYMKREIKRCTSFSKNLGVGDRGVNVRQLSMFLNKEGYMVRTSDNFDEEMAYSVVQFQQKHGIRPSGYFGPTTRVKANQVVECSTFEK